MMLLPLGEMIGSNLTVGLGHETVVMAIAIEIILDLDVIHAR